MKKISDLFEIFYGNKFDYSKMTPTNKGIAFVSRTSKNNGVVGYVETFNNKNPYPEGLITVSLGGTYVLSSFVQTKEFYTAQNVIVLKPKSQMSLNQKLYYCKCISMNRFRYSAFGREANKTLKDLLVPDITEIPVKILNATIPDYTNIDKPIINANIHINTDSWKEFYVKDIFDISLGTPQHKTNLEFKQNGIRYVTRSALNNGVVGLIDSKYITPEKGNCITIGAEGKTAFYQDEDFVTGNKVNILRIKNNKKLSIYSWLFYVTILNIEMRDKFCYGRAAVKSQIEKLKVRLPASSNGEPDYEYIDKYIKSLRYSNGIQY